MTEEQTKIGHVPFVEVNIWCEDCGAKFGRYSTYPVEFDENVKCPGCGKEFYFRVKCDLI
jgi:Zn finger protein HypA/HybF involved in hydrogenase expression